ncbi:hypothetical protein DEU35_1475 [Microbacterium sp. AG157]|uniref:hypothetical protein n=1 Tax=Microbacterium sp. AG157 TaxID=2183993 RepID=UPI000E3B189D|nr:hypothetical protein [Microbacterium sp. AG157]REC98375.1 hypothetical protein DEU35_1475 [Microbacterium sp. AG157]
MSDVTHDLLPAKVRWASAGAALAMVVLVCVYVLVPREVSTVAPQCEGGDSCSVLVTAQADPFVSIALLALVALFGVIGVTGLPFSVMLGNGAGLSPVPAPAKAETVRAAPADAEPVKVEVSPGEDGEKGLAAAERRSLDLYNALPIDIQQALLDWVAEEQGITDKTEVQLTLTEVSRKGGVGNHPYYVKGKAADGYSTYTVKLSRGGRGKREISANHAH